MSSLQSTGCRALAILLLLCGPVFTAAADEPRDTHELKTFFVVTVRQGPSAGLVASGVLTIDIKPGSDNFTGALTPSVDPDTGELQSSVLFQQVDHKFVPDPDGVTKIAVRGTIHGHAINLIMLNVLGDGKDIAGVGTLENALDGQGKAQEIGQVAGPAVGPEEGDSGDWITVSGPKILTAPPVITSANTTSIVQFLGVSFQVTATGVPPPSFFVTSGTLPGDFSLNASGLLTGDTITVSPGAYTFTITASNGISPNATQNFTLFVSGCKPGITC